MVKVYCCMCAETKTKKDLELRFNPYKFKKTAYCKTCDKGALISGEHK